MADYFQLRDENQINQARSVLGKLQNKILYSEKYNDDDYEYRHVILPRDFLRYIPKRLMTEQEWRHIGVQQSAGWVHYMIHKPEQNVLLFKRPLHPSSGETEQ